MNLLHASHSTPQREARRGDRWPILSRNRVRLRSIFSKRKDGNGPLDLDLSYGPAKRCAKRIDTFSRRRKRRSIDKLEAEGSLSVEPRGKVFAAKRLMRWKTNNRHTLARMLDRERDKHRSLLVSSLAAETQTTTRTSSIRRVVKTNALSTLPLCFSTIRPRTVVSDKPPATAAKEYKYPQEKKKSLVDKQP